MIGQTVIGWTLWATVRRWFEADLNPAQLRSRLNVLSRTISFLPGWVRVTAAAPGLTWIDAPESDQRRVLIYYHGGGYVSGGLASHGLFVAKLARQGRCRVLFVDYRLAPEHPFPAALDDALAAWTWAQKETMAGTRFFMGGDSAGGGLALAVIELLQAREESLPERVLLISPWVDLSQASGSHRSNDAMDSVMSSHALSKMAKLYLKDADPRDPRASPIHGALRAMPPTLIQYSTHEVLRDDAIKVAALLRDGGTKVIEESWPNMPHVFQLFWIFPQATSATRSLAQFLLGV